MSDAAAATGAPLPVRYKDKEYLLSPFDIDMAAMFERWLEDRAFAVVEARKDSVDGDTYEKMLAAVVEQCASGRYKLGSKAAADAAMSLDGQKFQFFLMLSKSNPKMTPKLAASIWESQVAEAKARMEVVNADPLGQEPPGVETMTDSP